MGIISLVASLVIILIFIFNKSLRSLTYYIVLGIAISEIFNSIACILFLAYGNEASTNRIVNFVQQAFFISSDMCTMVFLTLFSYSIYELINKGNTNIYMKIKPFMYIGFISPVVYTGILIGIMFAFDNIRYTKLFLVINTAEENPHYKGTPLFTCYINHSILFVLEIIMITFL